MTREKADAAFLHAFGERVRAARAKSGMSRRALAGHAGISERYITQLETGRGNVSILVLRQIAEALAVPLIELMGEAPSGGERVALIGLRGAGKTTLGRALAKSLGVPFFELDREVGRIAGTTLAALFEMYGQGAYRRYELQALRELIEKHPRFVLAAGGSIVAEPATYELLLRSCFTVWVRATPEQHIARVVAQGDRRPMAGSAQAMDDLRRILGERTPQYARAHASIDTSKRSEQASLKELRRRLQEL